MKIESWEQPTKKGNEVFYKLEKKYEKLQVLDIDIDDEDEDADLHTPPRQVVRLIDSVSWKTGRGNSYLVTALDIIDGKLIRSKITEYKIDTSLLGIIESATNTGHNKNVTFVREETSEDKDIGDGEADRGDDEGPGDSSSSGRFRFTLTIPHQNN